jgi:hypothetical protein
MKVIDLPSMERFTANSDFELKLVTTSSVGIARVPIRCPSVVRLSRKIGEVIPKWPSAVLLLKTPGKLPSAMGVLQVTATGVVPPAMSGTLTVPATQPGGNTVTRGTSSEAVPS